MKEFLGWPDYTRPAEGFMSWQHILFVTTLMAIMVACAVYFGRKNKDRSEKEKLFVLVIAAIAIDAFEIFKIVVMCLRANDPMGWTTELPLFLCSIMLIAIPLAAFSKGRIQQASLDFVMIFGILGAVLGTYGAAQNYGCYPVLGMDNVVSGITHSISGFSSLYIGITGLASMKKKNIPITLAVLFGFAASAMIANKILDYNYMFLVRGDGTPYDVLYNLVGGNKILYPMGVIGLFLLYILAFYVISFRLKARKLQKAEQAQAEQKETVMSGASND